MHDSSNYFSGDAGGGAYSHIVLSSRARLARNIAGLQFPHRLYQDDIAPIAGSINSFMAESQYRGNISLYWMRDLTPMDKRLMREVNLITSEMETSSISGIAIDQTDGFSVLINEEDHLRIQVIMPGLQLVDAYRKADCVDDELNRFTDYSFDEELGYLTSCTSNLGTALRISVLVHLPVLTMKNRITELIPEQSRKNIEVRGTFNNNRKTLGCIYQIFNKKSLGLSEIDIIESVDGFMGYVIEQEDTERDRYLNDNRLEVEDRVWRSLGLLLHARKLTYSEAMEHLSNLRLGVILAIIKNVDIGHINRIMVGIQLAHLQEWSRTFFSKPIEGDICRAGYIREELRNPEAF